MDIETTTVKLSGNLKHTFNVDASYDLKRRVTGIGIVIRETDQPRKKGAIIAEISELHNNIRSGEIEKFAVFRALEIASERNYQILHIRSDYNHMRRKLKEDHEAGIGHERDDLHGQVLRSAQKFKEVKFLYCRRPKNLMAHRLARKAVKESLPPENEPIIDFEPSQWDDDDWNEDLNEYWAND